MHQARFQLQVADFSARRLSIRAENMIIIIILLLLLLLLNTEKKALCQ